MAQCRVHHHPSRSGRIAKTVESPEHHNREEHDRCKSPNSAKPPACAVRARRRRSLPALIPAAWEPAKFAVLGRQRESSGQAGEQQTNHGGLPCETIEAVDCGQKETSDSHIGGRPDRCWPTPWAQRPRSKASKPATPPNSLLPIRKTITERPTVRHLPPGACERAGHALGHHPVP